MSKIQTVVKVLVCVSTLANTSAQAGRILEDLGGQIGRRVIHAFQPEIREGIEMVERGIGRRLPQTIRDEVIPPTPMTRLFRCISTTARSIGERLGLVERRTVLDRLENVLNDL